MQWLVLSYSLPAGPRSSARVGFWRRLKRLGAISLGSGDYVLPAREECTEALQWLAEEIGTAGGEAVIMHVESFGGLSDADLVERFCAARGGDYAELEQQAA